MDKDIHISKDFLDDAINNNARTLVGTIMKRFETFDEVSVIKSAIKELIYENSRTLKATLESFSNGVKFIKKPKEEKSS